MMCKFRSPIRMLQVSTLRPAPSRATSPYASLSYRFGLNRLNSKAALETLLYGRHFLGQLIAHFVTAASAPKLRAQRASTWSLSGVRSHLAKCSFQIVGRNRHLGGWFRTGQASDIHSDGQSTALLEKPWQCVVPLNADCASSAAVTICPVRHGGSVASSAVCYVVRCRPRNQAVRERLERCLSACSVR